MFNPAARASAALTVAALLLSACGPDEPPVPPVVEPVPAAQASGDSTPPPEKVAPRGAAPRGPLQPATAPSIDPQAVATARRFIDAASSGGAGDSQGAGLDQAADELFMSPQTFARTFKSDGQELDAAYRAHRQLFLDSLRYHADKLRGARFVTLEQTLEQQAMPYPAHASFGDLRLADQIVTLHNLAIVVTTADGQTHRLPIETMFKTDQGWRVIDPIPPAGEARHGDTDTR